MRDVRLAAATVLAALWVGACRGPSPDTPVIHHGVQIGQSAGIDHWGDRIVITPDGQLMVHAGAGFVYLDLDGTKVREANVDLPYHLVSFAVSPGGTIVALGQHWVMDETGKNVTAIRRHLYRFDTAGVILDTYDLPDAVRNEGSWSIDSVVEDSRGGLYLLTQGEVEALDTATHALRRVGSGGYRSMTMDRDDNLILARVTSDTYEVYLSKIRARDGREIWEVSYPRQIYGLAYRPDDKAILVADDSGIRRLDDSGKVRGQVFDIRASGLRGLPWYELAAAVDAKDTVYLIVPNPDYRTTQTGPASFLYRYDKATADAVQDSGTEITISHSYWWDRYLDSAISAYERAHPDIKIRVRKVLQQEDASGDGIQDFTAQLNTALLAGSAPDIVAAWGLPWKTYARKGLLVNLDTLIVGESPLDLEHYFQGVIDACRVDGALPVIPVSFSPSPLWANKRLLDEAGVRIDDTTWTWEDFYSIAAKLRRDADGDGTFEQCAISRRPGRAFFLSYLMPIATVLFVDVPARRATFDTPRFVAMLEKSKAFIDLNNQGNPYDSSESVWDQIKGGGLVFSADFSVTPSVGMIAHVRTLFDDDVLMLRMPSHGALGATFGSISLYGISTQSSRPRAAWDVLRRLLSEESLSADPSGSAELPVHRGVFQTRKDWVVKYTAEWGYGSGTAKITTIPDADIRAVETYVESQGSISYWEDPLSRLIGPELDPFYDGQTTAQETARAIQRKMEIYLRE